MKPSHIQTPRQERDACWIQSGEAIEHVYSEPKHWGIVVLAVVLAVFIFALTLIR